MWLHVALQGAGRYARFAPTLAMGMPDVSCHLVGDRLLASKTIAAHVLRGGQKHLRIFAWHDML